MACRKDAGTASAAFVPRTAQSRLLKVLRLEMGPRMGGYKSVVQSGD